MENKKLHSNTNYDIFVFEIYILQALVKFDQSLSYVPKYEKVKPKYLKFNSFNERILTYVLLDLPVDLIVKILLFHLFGMSLSLEVIVV